MGPHAALWPDTHPAEPPQAASEIDDDDQDRDGLGVFRGLRHAVRVALFLACAIALALFWRSA
jgi:hypothetical protein